MFPAVPPLDRELINRLVSKAFPRRKLSHVKPLPGGLCNSNLKAEFEDHYPPVVVRIYEREPQACAKEIELLQLVRQTVPVPEVFYSEPDSEVRPIAILEFVDGMTFQELKRTTDSKATQQASYEVGKTLAAIGKYSFTKPGRIMRGLEIGAPYVQSSEPMVELVEKFSASANLQRRVDRRLIKDVSAFVWSWSPRLPAVNNERQLVHSDFGSRNILMKQVGDTWTVAAVLDWEFAFSGSPLLDVGHFLRYEKKSNPLREPFFSRGYLEHGGRLPDDWWSVVKVIDLTALCEMLTRDELPADVVAELVQLIRDTLKENLPAIEKLSKNRPRKHTNQH